MVKRRNKAYWQSNGRTVNNRLVKSLKNHRFEYYNYKKEGKPYYE